MVDNIETAKMSERGQVIIPKNIRKFIDARENTLFTIMPVDSETIVMKKLDKRKIIAEFAGIRAKVKNKLSSKEINEEINKSRY